MLVVMEMGENSDTLGIRYIMRLVRNIRSGKQEMWPYVSLRTFVVNIILHVYHYPSPGIVRFHLLATWTVLSSTWSLAGLLANIAKSSSA